MSSVDRSPSRVPPTPGIEGAGVVLSLIRSGRARTVTELAATMDVARSTVAQRVNHLVSAGLVAIGPAVLAEPAGRGRPAAVLSFRPGAGVVLVGQLGMTGARVAATDLEGAILAERFDPFPIEAGPEHVVDELEASLTGVLADAGKNGGDIRGVGVGLPSAVELATMRAPVTPMGPRWEDYPVAARLESRFGAPSFVGTDVNLLALGEQRSAWPEADVLLCVKVGSVIGCGVVVRGEVVQGAQGAAGNIGHIAVPGDETPCVCGSRGCLDAVAGGRALVARLQREGLSVTDVRHLTNLAREGVPAAAHAVREAGRCIGEVLAYAVNLLNPDVITVWGYLASADTELLAGMREAVYGRSLPATTKSLHLVRARLGEGAGLVGAAMMVVSQILSPEAVDASVAAWAVTAEGH